MGDGLMAVLPDEFFNRTILHRLSATGLLGGVIVLESGAADGGGGRVESPGHYFAQGDVGRSNPDVKTPQVWQHHVVDFAAGRVFSFLHNIRFD